MSDEAKYTYEEYESAYDLDPFSDRTIELRETLMALVGGERKERWNEVMSSIDMTHNSKRAWATIRKLDCENAPPKRVAGVTPNAGAH